MSVKYHINPKTGKVGICRAKIACRFGGNQDHFESKGEADAASEKMMIKRYDELPSFNKVGQNVTTSSIDRITNYYEPHPHYGETWDAALNDYNDKVVDELEKEIKEKGEFEEPVVLISDDIDKSYRVGDGMKRIIAAHRAGMKNIKVADSFKNEKEETMRLEVKLKDDADQRFQNLNKQLSWRHEGENDSAWISLETVTWKMGDDPSKLKLFLTGTEGKDVDKEAVLKDLEKRASMIESINEAEWKDLNLNDDDETL